MKYLLFFIGISLFGVFFQTSRLGAETESDKAYKLIREGYECFKKGDYQKAIQSFQASYQIVKHPMRLQNIARCYEKLARYAKSIEYRFDYILAQKKDIEAENKELLKLARLYDRDKEDIPLEKLSQWSATLLSLNFRDKVTALHPITALTLVKKQLYSRAIPAIKEMIKAMSGSQDKEDRAILKDILNQSKTRFLKRLSLYLTEGDIAFKQQVFKESLASYEKARVFFHSFPAFDPADPLKAVIEDKITTAKNRWLEEQAQKTKVLVTISTPVDKKPKKMKIWGWTAIGAGTTVFVVAVVLLALAAENIASARTIYNNEYYVNPTNSQAYSDFETTRNSAKIYLGTGVTLGAIGLTAIITGIWVLAKSKKR